MPTTPILGITQVSTSQNGKETTINDAVLALENAGNATLSKDFSAGDVTLTASEATRNFIFVATGATMARNLNFPLTVNGNPLNRVIAVRNESGYALTVKFVTGAGTTVTIPDGEARLISAADGVDMIVAAEAPSVITFISLTDVPGSYTGEAGKFLAVNIAENALEFINGASFPTFTGEAGKHLVVNLAETGVEWVDPVTDFLSLTDSPNSYTGHANKLVAVKATEDGVEFVDAPEAEAVEFVAAARWRIFVIDPGLEPEIGFGEVEFLDIDYIDLTGSGTASASNADTGFGAAEAFDNDLTAGTGWLTQAAYVGDVWLEYDFGTPVTVRRVKLHPITSLPDYSPTRFYIEYYNGASWVSLGDRITETWVDSTPQTFKVNGIPLTSVADAAADGVPYVRRNAAWEDAREWIRDAIGTALAEGAGIDITVNDAGDTITIAASGGTYNVPFGFVSVPTASEVMLIHVFAESVTFADEFAGSVSRIGVNPAATFTFTVQKNGGSVGSISVSNTGVATFTTTGGTVSFVAGDYMTIIAQAGVDTIASSAFTFKGTKA